MRVRRLVAVDLMLGRYVRTDLGRPAIPMRAHRVRGRNGLAYTDEYRVCTC